MSKRNSKRISKKPKRLDEEFSIEETEPSPIDFSSMIEEKMLENGSSSDNQYMYPSVAPDIEIDINRIEEKKIVPRSNKKVDESNGIITGTRVADKVLGHNPEDYLSEQPAHWGEDPEGLLGDITLEGPGQHIDAVEEGAVPIEEEFSNFDFMVNAMYNFQSFTYNTIDSYLYKSGRTSKLGLGEKFDMEKAGFINCYAQIIKKHGDHRIIQVLTDPVFLWGTMSLGIVAAHVKENGVNKNIAN